MTDPAPWEDGPYSIKRHGVTITNCDAEPVHTPGCIQDCGALLVLRLSDLAVLQASENCAAWLGEPPERRLGRPAAAVLGDERAARLRDMLGGEGIEHNPTYCFTLPACSLPGKQPPVELDVTVHAIDGFAVLELEPAATASGLDAYVMLRRAAARLQAASTLQGFCDAAAEEVRRVTRFDRVMIYRFHADAHGEVFAERRRSDLPAWLGLHYPAEDIPRPARAIFEKIWVRPLPDARCALHELVPLANPDTGRPFDMTYCALRGASVMYTEYLQNMGVAASLTMAIRSQGELWGLIACHHYSAPAPAPWPVRAACELLAQVVSLQLKTAEEREQLSYRLRIEGVHQELVAHAAQGGPLAAMLEGQPALLDGIEAHGAALFHLGRWWRVGRTPEEPQLEALASWLESRPELVSPTRPPYATDCLSREWPEAAAITAVASGVLAISLSRSRRTILLWFRPETAEEVRWAGNPHDKPSVLGPHGPRLTPRASFALFLESVRGRSRPWLAVEVEAASRLRLLIMELVVSRAEQLASLNADLSRSNEELDAFAYLASHDLKEPLRGIHNHAHHLLANADILDEVNRHRVEGLMRLTLRMDALLDSLLHFSRVGRIQLEYEDVDLGEVLAEAIEMVGVRAADRHGQIDVPRPLPVVRCDRVRIREVLVNLLSNALKYNDQPVPHIEVGYLAPGEPIPMGGAAPPEARGSTVYFVRDDGIGIDPRHFGQVWSMFKRLHGRDAYGGGTGAGLTIVKKLVERHGGQVWLDSTTGEGTTFFFTLPAPPARKGGDGG
jgi:two-component system, chemotaxis family, sensor kinase Cph1